MNDLKFQTINELNEYFNHEKITCLLCGLKFRGLYRHIEKTHKLHPDDYKLQFGIPPKYGLIGNETKKLLHENGIILQETYPEIKKVFLSIARKKKSKHKLGFTLKGYPALQKKQTEICRKISKLPNHISKASGYVDMNCFDCGSVVKKRAVVKNRKKVFCKKCITKHQNQSCYNTPSYLDRERMKEYWRAFYHLKKNGNNIPMNQYIKKYSISGCLEEM